MATKILANLIIMGSGLLARAFVEAYRKALKSGKMGGGFHNGQNGFGLDAQNRGVTQETLQNVTRRGSKAMTEQEARQILGVSEHSSWEEIAEKYDNLFEKNMKNGSFYLQSKVQRDKECLETVYQAKD